MQKEGTYEGLESLASRLADGITQAFATAEIPATLNRVGSMMTGFLNPGPVDSLGQVEQSNTEPYGRYFHAMLERGVYLAPSQFEAGFVSLAHAEEDVDRTVADSRGCAEEFGVNW